MASRLLISIICFALFLLPASPPAAVVDRSVAIVNDETITLSEVNELGKAYFKKITEEAPPDRLNEAMRQARRTVLDKLIDKKLLIHEATKLNMKVSDDEVENALQRILANNKTSPEQFRKEINELGMNESQYREDLRDQILTSKLVNHEVRSKVVIPEEKILDYYDTHYTERVGGGGYYILQLGAVWGGKDRQGKVPTQEDARAKIEALRKRALKGENFNDLAREHSDLPSSSDGGDLGLFQKNEMSAAMRDAVTSLQSGAISEIVETDSDYQFFKLVSSQEGKILAKVPYDAAKEEIREKLYQQEMELRYKEWFKEIREKAYIKIL